MRALLILVAAYLLGSIPTGLWLGRLAGIDVRSAGSGNIGATNVARTAGLRLGLITLLFDFLKGAFPVLATFQLSDDPSLPAAAALCAFFGHIFSAFAGFRGGKGVATAAGGFLVLSPAAMAGAVVVFAVVAYLSRIVSLASLSAGLALPAFATLLGFDGPTRWAALSVGLTLVFTHRENIRRLRAGTEPRFGTRASKQP